MPSVWPTTVNKEGTKGQHRRWTNERFNERTKRSTRLKWILLLVDWNQTWDYFYENPLEVYTDGFDNDKLYTQAFLKMNLGLNQWSWADATFLYYMFRPRVLYLRFVPPSHTLDRRWEVRVFGFEWAMIHCIIRPPPPPKHTHTQTHTLAPFPLHFASHSLTWLVVWVYGIVSIHSGGEGTNLRIFPPVFRKERSASVIVTTRRETGSLQFPFCP